MAWSLQNNFQHLNPPLSLDFLRHGFDAADTLVAVGKSDVNLDERDGTWRGDGQRRHGYADPRRPR